MRHANEDNSNNMDIYDRFQLQYCIWTDDL